MKEKNLNYKEELKKIISTDELHEVYDEFHKLIKKVLIDFSRSVSPDQIKVVFQNLLQRIYIGIDAVDSLLHKLKHNTYHKYSIAVQIRTCLLDSLTIAYFALHEADADKFNKELLRLTQAIARQLYNEVQESIKNGNTNYKEDLELFRAQFPENFTSGDKIKLQNGIKDLFPGEMAKALKDTPYVKCMDIYNLYLQYSIYGHYSPTSKFLLDNNVEVDFSKLIISSFYIFHSSYLAVQFMETDYMTKKQMKNIRDKTGKIKLTYAG